MDIKINSSVMSHGGQEIGKVARMVLNPSTYDVDQLVVATDEGERVVPLNMVESATPGIVRLRVDADVIRQLKVFEAGAFEEAPETCPAVTNMGKQHAYPPSTFLLSAEMKSTLMHATPQAAQPGSEKKRFTLTVGTEVMALDGKIGVIDEVLTDQYEDKALGFMIRREGSQKDIRVPIEWVASLSSGCVHLSVTKEQLEKHPLPPDGMYIPASDEGQPST